MIEVSITRLSAERLKRLARELGRLRAASFLKTVKTSDIEGELKEYLRRISFSDSGRERFDRLLKRGLSPKAIAFADKPISDMWVVRRETDGRNIRLVITNKLATQGGKRGKSRFEAIELGVRGGTVTYANLKPFVFLGSQGWVTVVPGTTHNRPPRAGKNYLGRTTSYFEEVLLPKARLRITQTIAERIRNA